MTIVNFGIRQNRATVNFKNDPLQEKFLEKKARKTIMMHMGLYMYFNSDTEICCPL